LREAADAVGVDDQHLGELLALELAVESVAVTDGGDEARTSIATGGLILTYMAVLMYGAWTLMGVTEEKSSRVVELILATVRPRHLLAGKVLGIGSLAVGQMLLIAGVLIGVGVGVGTLGTVDSTSGVNLTTIPLDVVGILLVWFIAGFALYNTMFAAVGSLISRIEDAQSVNLPIALGVVASVAISFFVLERPSSPVGAVATFVPLSAPFVAPVRYALGVLPAWQLVVALVITVGFTWVMVRVAGRIYQGAILRVGGKVSLRHAWRGLE
jgi:ABC-2 type transport system permease protein